MKLYIANGSTNCRKVQAVANHLGITIETIYLDYMKGDPKFRLSQNQSHGKGPGAGR